MAVLALAASAPGLAQRLPVLKQIDLPHNYYFREMYLPQLTSGPSAVAWSPDGQWLAYSMAGNLWKQRLDSSRAEQLTAGPGYDYQPDWSPSGRYLVFVRYLADAMELMQLDLQTGEVTPLTRGGAVNVEPRWSPDGTRLAWVSTAGTGHFHVFVGTPDPAGLTGTAIQPEHRSAVPRYYYSAFDHEISPTWSPDGKELIYVSNPETIYGTGGLWRRSLTDGAKPIPVRIEETTWKARPHWSPDGKRVIYSSYLGQPWHQLWITTAAGGDPFPLSYGEYDVTGARWSPDGQRIAYISNRSGTTELWIQDVIGGRQRRLEIREMHYLRPMGELRLLTVNAAGKQVASRVAVLGADGRSYAPDDARIHADDSFDRRRSPFETRYFHTGGEARLTLPAGAAAVTVWRGLENQIVTRKLNVVPDQTQTVTVQVQALALPSGWSDQWLSGDVHVHMNYGGAYRNTPERLVRQAAAEDLDVVHNLIVNKEQRVPDIAYFSPQPDPASTPAVLLLHSQEYHTSYWGHLGLLGLDDHFLMPDYAAYSNTAAASPYPTNAVIAELAHQQNALVGYVHPFDASPDPAKDPQLTNALPVDVALGKVDYYEVLGFSDHRATAAVWYRLLNCGFRVSAAAGTDAMANFASLRGPVGLNRVYVLTAAGEQPLKERWLAGLKAGATMATNGPLLGLSVEGHQPGAAIPLVAGQTEVNYRGFMRSVVPVDHLELIQNGKVTRTIRLTGERKSADIEGRIKVTGPGWLLLRAWNDGASPEIFDIYPYATTNPVFLEGDRKAVGCGPDAGYFLAWIDRIRSAAETHPDYNTVAEREATLAEIQTARGVFETRR